MTRAEMMCADSSVLLGKLYSVCVVADLFAAPQEEQCCSCVWLTDRERQRCMAELVTAGMNEALQKKYGRKKKNAQESPTSPISQLHEENNVFRP